MESCQHDQWLNRSRPFATRRLEPAPDFLLASIDTRSNRCERDVCLDVRVLFGDDVFKSLARRLFIADL